MTINKNHLIITIYFIIFCTQELITGMQLVGQAINIIYGLVLFILLLSGKIKFKNERTKLVQNIMLVVISIFIIFGTISFMYNNNGGPALFLKILSPMIVGAIIYYNHIDTKFMNKIYYLIVLAIIYKWVLVGNENIVFNSSRNMISLFFLFMNCLDIFVRYKNHDRQDYKKVLLTVIFSFIAKGRSGIIISCLFLFITIFKEIFSKGIKSKIKLLLFIIILIVLFIYSLDFIDIYLESFDRFGTETGRTDYWIMYFNSIKDNLFNLLFGTKLTSFYMLKIVDFNLHNAFLMSHANYGLLIFVSLVVLLGLGLITSLKNNNYSIFIIIFLLLSKGNIDYVFFHSYCDILIFCVLFYVIDYLKTLKIHDYIFYKERLIYESSNR